MAPITRTEQRVLEAATKVFLKKGRDGARMQEIARTAGINQALLHYYFRTKDRLYEAVFKRQFEEFIGGFLDSIPKTDDVQEFLRFFVCYYIDRLASHPDLIPFILWEIRQGGTVVSDLLKQYLYRGADRPFVLDIIEAGVHRGAIRAVDPVHLTISLIGVCVYPFIARPVLEQVFPGLDVLSPAFLEKRKAEITALFWEGIRAGQM